MCYWVKAEVGQVVGLGLDQIPSAGFRGVRLGCFLSKPKPVCETMGSGFVEGDAIMDVGLGSRPVAGPRFSSDTGSASSLEVAKGSQAWLVSSPSTVITLSSCATRGLEVC
jgi:hypothetical protein